ncbi:uncharacterized protein [Argopecten irradians]|uniref:uncharacterized protein n=1 Tax=Argopecten irradians TaxID=31199 RepID=UPI00371F0E39
MSRAAVSKSRADKGAKPGPPAHTPVVAHEIVPGKFNDQDWTFMVEKDGSEEFVEDIIDELVDNTLDVIYNNYIGQQLLPFNVTMAKDAILQIIEWQFLSRDEGEQEVETDPGWMEDEEPDPAETDCWAQGSVPKALVPERPMTPVEEISEEKAEEEAVPEEVEEEKVEEEEPPELADKVSDTEEGQNKEEIKTSQEEEKKKKTERTKYKPYTGRVKAGKGLNQMTESLEQTEMAMMYEEYVKSQEYEAAEKASGLLNMPVSCHSILKVQAGRPPGNKDVMYDDMGNVLAVIKLNPEKLPSHRVKVKYQVVDPAVEAAQARLEAMRQRSIYEQGYQRRLKRNKVEEIKPEEAPQEAIPQSTNSKTVWEDTEIAKSTLLVGSSILRLVERKKLQLNMDVRTYRGASINTVREKLQTMPLTDYSRVIIHVGGDDVSNGRGEQDIHDDFIQLTSYIKSSNPDIQVIYVAITPRTDCDIIPTNRCLQDMCSECRIHFIPSYSVFVDQDNFQRNGLYSRDVLYDKESLLLGELIGDECGYESLLELSEGSVPKALVPERPMTPVEEISEEKAEEEAVPEEVEEEKVEEEEPPELADKVSDTEEGQNKEEIKTSQEEEKKKKRTKYKPYTGRVKAGKGLNQMTESLEQTEMAMMYEEYVKSQEYEAAEKASGLLNMPVSCHSILKVQAGRPPGNKDVMYDDMGNVLAVIKLNPEKLPSHRVKVKYQVVDPAVEAAQARLEAMRHGRYMSRAIQRRLKRNKVEEIKPEEGNRYSAWRYEDLLAIEMCQNPVKETNNAVSMGTTHRQNYAPIPSVNQSYNLAGEITSRKDEFRENLQEEHPAHTSTNPNFHGIPGYSGVNVCNSYSIHSLVSIIMDLQADVKTLHAKLDEMNMARKEKLHLVDGSTQTDNTESSQKGQMDVREKGQLESSEKGQNVVRESPVKTYAQVVSQSPVAVKERKCSNISGRFLSLSAPQEAIPQSTNSKTVWEDTEIAKSTLLVGSSILRLVERKKLQLNMDVRTYRGASINTVREKLQTMPLTDYSRVIIHVGGDDVSNGRGEQDIHDDFIQLTSYIKSSNPDIQVIYVAITPRTDCDIIPTNRCLQDMCSECRIHFIPSYSVFVDQDNFQRNGLYSRDGIHLTKYGTAIFLKNIDKYLSPGILPTKSEDIKLENGFQKDMKTPLPPPLTDTMEISPGVTVKEGGRVRRGPARYVRKVDKFTESQQSLRPVATRTTAPSLEVADLLDRQTPILRVMRDSPPLPPIVPHPPAQSRIST